MGTVTLSSTLDQYELRLDRAWRIFWRYCFMYLPSFLPFATCYILAMQAAGTSWTWAGAVLWHAILCAVGAVCFWWNEHNGDFQGYYELSGVNAVVKTWKGDGEGLYVLFSGWFAVFEFVVWVTAGVIAGGIYAAYTFLKWVFFILAVLIRSFVRVVARPWMN
jgi:hypothetical protein